MNVYFFVNILQVVKNKFVSYNNPGGLIIPNNFYCCRYAVAVQDELLINNP